ncbi:MAG: hypothetical protein QM808_07360 [Steroidobacteraceae bacterium]
MELLTLELERELELELAALLMLLLELVLALPVAGVELLDSESVPPPEQACNVMHTSVSAIL